MREIAAQTFDLQSKRVLPSMLRALKNFREISAKVFSKTISPNEEPGNALKGDFRELVLRFVHHREFGGNHTNTQNKQPFGQY
jgi:hypothetical protein